MKEFKLNTSARKQDILDQYAKLLDGYKKKVKDKYMCQFALFVNSWVSHGPASGTVLIGILYYL